MNTSPRVSVVMATYNRSGVLRFAIGSVVAQSFEDWELLVVGDACTDDTAQVVESFDDPRIRFANLPVNFGEQSGPNNLGVARTTGRYLAFLNHDDLWFDDHLEVAVATLEARHADMVFSPCLQIQPGSDLAAGRPIVVVDGLSRNGRYDPSVLDRANPASAWLLRRELHEALGGWRSARDIVRVPSSDFIFRAHRAGHDIWSTGVPTLLRFPSGDRPGSYVDGATTEHQWAVDAMADPASRTSLLAQAVGVTSADLARADADRPRRTRALRHGLRLLPRVGILSDAARLWLRGMRRGTWVQTIRGTRGLDPRLPTADTAEEIRYQAVLRSCHVAVGETIDFTASGSGARILARGWSAPEPEFTWNDGTTAALAVRPDTDDPSPLTLTLSLVAQIDEAAGRQRITARVRGDVVVDLAIDEPEVVELEVPLGDWSPARPTVIELELPDAAARGDDPRELAIQVRTARLERAAAPS